MFCTNCGQKLSDDATVCCNCGFVLKTHHKNETVLPKNGQAPCQTRQNVNRNLNGNNNVSCKRTKPLSTANFFFAQILFLIPILNIFFIIYWSFKKDINENLKSYSRSMLIWTIIAAIFSVFALLTFAFMQSPLSFSFKFNS